MKTFMGMGILFECDCLALARKRDAAWIENLTSDKNVCAAFWAPTCSRYSYTYNANLKRRGAVMK